LAIFSTYSGLFHGILKITTSVKGISIFINQASSNLAKSLDNQIDHQTHISFLAQAESFQLFATFLMSHTKLSYLPQLQILQNSLNPDKNVSKTVQV
jgi:hypothetical protein